MSAIRPLLGGKVPWHAIRLVTPTLCIGALVASGLIVANPTQAEAQAPVVATWTGASGASYNWSDPANWSPAVAPANGATLAFPAPSGASTEFSNDDLANLSLSSITMETGSGFASAYQVGSPAGTTISLGAGGFTSSDPSAAPSILPNSIDIPIRLAASQTWTVTGAGPELDGALNGSSSALTIDLAVAKAGSTSAPGSLYLYGDPQVGPVDIAGSDSANIGFDAGLGNGFVVLLDGLNGRNGNPVSVTDAGLFAAGSLGPLSVHRGELFVGSLALGVLTPSGSTAGSLSAHVKGAASFDHASGVVFAGLESSAVPGTTYPQLSSSGALALGEAQLALGESCNATFSPGDQLTLVKGAPVRGTFSFPGTSRPIRSGDLVRVPPPQSCHSKAPTELQFDYTRSRVTATVVGAQGAGTSALRVQHQAVRHGSALRLGLDCASALPCTGTASVTVRQTVIAEGHFTLAARHSAIATLPLTPAGRKLLAALGPQRRSAIVTITLPGGQRSRHPITMLASPLVA